MFVVFRKDTVLEGHCTIVYKQQIIYPFYWAPILENLIIFEGQAHILGYWLGAVTNCIPDGYSMASALTANVFDLLTNMSASQEWSTLFDISVEIFVHPCRYDTTAPAEAGCTHSEPFELPTPAMV